MASSETPAFKRTTLVVADLERSLAFYQNVLGFTVDYRKESAKDSYSYAVFAFPADAKLRFATLNSPTQERTLALTEVTGVTLPPVPLPHRTATVINCAAFDDVVAKVHALGLKVVPEQVLKGNDGVAKGREIAFVDPDGHLIVMYKLFSQ